MIQIQRTTITFEIFTKASEPLVLLGSEKSALIQALELGVKNNVDLRYFPESRHIEERHELLGVGIAS